MLADEEAAFANDAESAVDAGGEGDCEGAALFLEEVGAIEGAAASSAAAALRPPRKALLLAVLADAEKAEAGKDVGLDRLLDDAAEEAEAEAEALVALPSEDAASVTDRGLLSALPDAAHSAAFPLLPAFRPRDSAFFCRFPKAEAAAEVSASTAGSAAAVALPLLLLDGMPFAPEAEAVGALPVCISL